MGAFILRRLLQAIVVMVSVGFIAFLLFQYVGDPVLILLGQDATPDQIRQLRADPARRARYAQAAVATGQRFHIAQVAPAYMQLFERAMAQRRGRVGGGTQMKG